MPKKTYRDFVIFFCLTVFIVAHFLLQDYPETEFYLALMVLSLFGLLLLKHYHKDTEFPFDFDENLTLPKWVWIIGCTAVVYAITSFFSGIVAAAGAFSPIVVPRFGYSVNYVILGALPTYVNDMLFNITLVAPAEELCKLVTMTALFIYLSAWIHDKKIKYVLAVGVPIAFWSILHVYSNPVYIANPLFVVSAFNSGIVLVIALWKTESILAAILCHGFFNCIVIFLWNQGFLLVPTA